MYSRITGSKDGRDAIRYAEGKGPGQNGRNVLVTTINMIPNGKYAEQMAPYWKKARANHKVQVRRIIISFSKKELDPNSEADVELANTIVKEFIRTYYPDRQAVLFFQNDGEGGCLHCHVIVNDISLTDHKGCSRTQQYYKFVRNGIDTVAAKYIELDDGGKLTSRQTHTERAKAERAAKLMEEHPELQGDKLRKVLIENKAYSYKEDMKQRIHEAALKSFDIVSFFKELKARGIEAIKKISPKYGEHFVYDFKVCPVGVKNTKARSYKLGYSYSPESVRLIWQEKTKNDQPAGKGGENTFTSLLLKQSQSIFEYGTDGKLTGADFDLIDRLHEEYLEAETPALADMSQMANSIKNIQRKRNSTTRRRAKKAEEELSFAKKRTDRQNEYSL